MCFVADANHWTLPHSPRPSCLASRRPTTPKLGIITDGRDRQLLDCNSIVKVKGTLGHQLPGQADDCGAGITQAGESRFSEQLGCGSNRLKQPFGRNKGASSRHCATRRALAMHANRPSGKLGSLGGNSGSTPMLSLAPPSSGSPWHGQPVSQAMDAASPLSLGHMVGTV